MSAEIILKQARAFLLLISLSLLTGCATHRLQTDVDKTPSNALPPAESGQVHDISQQLNSASGAEESEFMLLPDNLDALRWRLLFADLAEQSIDVQYYLIDSDDSSRLFGLALVRAANRGVRVRLLVDDIFLMNRDNRIATWDEHPFIEIRVFNPWRKRGSLIQKGLEYLGYSERLNQRMHNKLFAVDNQIAIIGGRNIGDAYFGLGNKYNFRDLDVILAGPMVGKVSDSFDLYWNDDWTVPASAFARPGHKPLSQEEMIRESMALLDKSEKVRSAGLLEPVPSQKLLKQLAATSIYGQAWAVYDDPPSEISNDRGVRKIDQLEDIDAEIERELLIASPYFVASDMFLEKLRGLTQRGVRVRLLTNSLGSTNHTMVHSGYRPWRRRLIDAGVELYEYRSDATDTAEVLAPGTNSGFTSLHTKTFVIDREFVYLGSLNMDPRSFHINTEMGLLVASPPLAEQVAKLIERDMGPDNAWQLTLDDEERLIWASKAGATHLQPARSFAQRLADFFYGLLPIKEQL
jgi:putative cardiolipin synthase